MKHPDEIFKAFRTGRRFVAFGGGYQGRRNINYAIQLAAATTAESLARKLSKKDFIMVHDEIVWLDEMPADFDPSGL